jgi:hypothetical protein
MAIHQSPNASDFRLGSTPKRWSIPLSRGVGPEGNGEALNKMIAAFNQITSTQPSSFAENDNKDDGNDDMQKDKVNFMVEVTTHRQVIPKILNTMRTKVTLVEMILALVIEEVAANRGAVIEGDSSKMASRIMRRR